MNRLRQIGDDLYTGKRTFDFVYNLKRNLGLGALLITASLVSLLLFGLNQGIEFTGGSEFRITGASDPNPAIGADIVASASTEIGAPEATVLGSNNVRIQTERLDDVKTDSVRTQLAEAYGVDSAAVTSSYVGPSWGQDVSSKALTGLFVFLALATVLMIAYFRTYAMALGAIIALFHDLFITIGVYAASRFEVTPAAVIGFLTILGYSLYDTVVVFDKVRENNVHAWASKKRTLAESTNLAVNQTLVRSINTSVVALLPVGSILFIGALLFGAGTLRDIALALFVGMLVGTYSSIFIAPAVYVWVRNRQPGVKEHDREVLARRAQREEHAAKIASGDIDPDADKSIRARKRALANVPTVSGQQRVQPRRTRRRER